MRRSRHEHVKVYQSGMMGRERSQGCKGEKNTHAARGIYPRARPPAGGGTKGGVIFHRGLLSLGGSDYSAVGFSFVKIYHLHASSTARKSRSSSCATLNASAVSGPPPLDALSAQRVQEFGGMLSNALPSRPNSATVCTAR